MKDRGRFAPSCAATARSCVFCGHIFERTPAYRPCPILHIAVHIEVGEGRKFLSGCSLSQPIETTLCLGTAMRHRSLSEAALTGHRLGVLSAGFRSAKSRQG